MDGKVVVIGAGMGGLSCAAQLAARGFQVTVVEKEVSVGGKARRVEIDGRQVDAGPTVFTMRDVFDGIFEACGEQLEDHVNIRRADVIARHAWSEDERLDLFADPLRSEEAVGDFAGAEAAKGYRAFRHETRRMYNILNEPMMRGDNVSTPLPLLWRIGLWRFGDFFAMRPHQSMWKALGQFFPDHRLRQLFGRYATYCGSSPFAAPATLMLIAHVEATGVWLIEGGIHALAEALRKVAEKKGVRFRTGTAVAEIMCERGRGATGVRLTNGEVIASRYCDLQRRSGQCHCRGQIRRAYRAKGRAKSLAHMPDAKRSLSALCLVRACARPAGFDLTHHNVFFSPDYAREFSRYRRWSPGLLTPLSMSARRIAADWFWFGRWSGVRR